MQPLSRVRKDAHVYFGQDDTMTARPKAATKVAEYIAEWSNIETLLGIFLGFLLHSKAPTILKMFRALDNRAAQLRLLESAAKSELKPPQFDIFVVLMEQFIRPVMRTRDKFAHWCWGHAPELPDALLLMSPDEALYVHFVFLKGSDSVSDDKVFVVTESYLDRSLKELRKAQSYLAMLIQSLDVFAVATPRVQQPLARLSSVPAIREGLARLREKEAKLQAKQKQSPPKDDQD
jgi:hypothetical protein